MERILICLEAMDYSYIISQDLPVLMSLDVHPAVAFGLGSRPSAAALMGGMLPVCQIPRCEHRKLREIWSNPFFLTCTTKITEQQFYLCPNGWIIEILMPWMTQEQRKLNMKWHDEHLKCPSTEIVDYFFNETEGKSDYFAYLHFFESHWPFYHPDGTGERDRSVKFLDGLVGRVIDAKPNAEIVVVSDHNIPPRIKSAAEDVPAAVTMLSFIGSNKVAFEGKSWAEMGIDAHQSARDYWL